MKAIKSVKPVNSCDCDSVNKEIVEKVKKNFLMMKFLEIYQTSLKL